MTDFDAYIAVRAPDEHGEFEAILVPAGVSTRDRYDHEVRRIRSGEDLDELRREWGVSEARGDGLDQLPARAVE